MTEENPKKETPEMLAQATDEPNTTQTKGELIAVADDHKTESTQEKDTAQNAAEEELNTNAKYKVEDAICHIISENTRDYKDFHFPTNKMNVLLYRMHHEINGRIQAFKEDNMEVEDIVTAYRNRHSKADDIEFLTETYQDMDLRSESARSLPKPATANAGPNVAPSTSWLVFPELFRPIGSQAAGLEPRERVLIRRRSVRCLTSHVPECRQEGETKEKEK